MYKQTNLFGTSLSGWLVATKTPAEGAPQSGPGSPSSRQRGRTGSGQGQGGNGSHDSDDHDLWTCWIPCWMTFLGRAIFFFFQNQALWSWKMRIAGNSLISRNEIALRTKPVPEAGRGFLSHLFFSSLCLIDSEKKSCWSSIAFSTGSTDGNSQHNHHDAWQTCMSWQYPGSTRGLGSLQSQQPGWVFYAIHVFEWNSFFVDLPMQWTR